MWLLTANTMYWPQDKRNKMVSQFISLQEVKKFNYISNNDQDISVVHYTCLFM